MSTQGVVCSALERVNDLLKCETAAAAVKELLDRAVEQLNSDLGAVADTASSDADAERNRRVRELAYEIEDSVECFVGSKWSGTGTGSYLRCLFKYCSSERRFVEDLHVFSRRARELMTTTDNHNPHQHLPSEHVGIKMPHLFSTNYQDRNAVIVFDDYLENVRELLTGPYTERRLSVIPLCGMGGIGKSTLARMAYTDHMVIYHFDMRAWVTVGQNFNSRDILLTLLYPLTPDTSRKNLAAMETGELTIMLHQTLFGRRYLICLDDVWATDVWDSLRIVFPDTDNGSRILITTRSMDVACNTSRSTPPIQMKLLDEEQSLQLLLSKSGLQQHLGTRNSEVMEIAKEIARSCNGLPLAITVVSQILSMTSLEDWKLILRHQQRDQQSRSDEAELLHNIMKLSYEDLPFRLRPCFLYIGHFPPYEPIPAEKLNLLWMAEGLISKTNEAADQEYFKELVTRSLLNRVEAGDLLASTKFKSFEVHDSIRNLCISLGKEEEFFNIIDFLHATVLSLSACRLAVYLDKYEDTSDVTLSIPDAKRIT